MLVLELPCNWIQQQERELDANQEYNHHEESFNM